MIPCSDTLNYALPDLQNMERGPAIPCNRLKTAVLYSSNRTKWKASLRQKTSSSFHGFGPWATDLSTALFGLTGPRSHRLPRRL